MANPYPPKKVAKKAAKKPMKKVAKKAMPKGKAAPTPFSAFLAKKGTPAMKTDPEVTPRAEAMARVRALSKP